MSPSSPDPPNGAAVRVIYRGPSYATSHTHQAAATCAMPGCSRCRPCGLHPSAAARLEGPTGANMKHPQHLAMQPITTAIKPGALTHADPRIRVWGLRHTGNRGCRTSRHKYPGHRRKTYTRPHTAVTEHQPKGQVMTNIEVFIPPIDIDTRCKCTRQPTEPAFSHVSGPSTKGQHTGKLGTRAGSKPKVACSHQGGGANRTAACLRTTVSRAASLATGIGRATTMLKKKRELL